MRVGTLKLKLQIVCGESFAMGPGKADLLDAIVREGSIKRAGVAIGMSYRRTWLLVDEMNRCFRERLVETHAGGGHDRGARLTAHGRAMLEAYRSLERESARVAELPGYRALADAVLDAPRPARAGSGA